MQNSEKIPGKGFILRYSAGMYNILNVYHPGIAYVKPLQVNETAAKVFMELENKKTPDEIARCFSKEYGIELDMAMKDIDEIIEQFKKYGITID